MNSDTITCFIRLTEWNYSNSQNYVLYRDINIQLDLVLLCFALLHFADVAYFYKFKVRLSTSKKVTARFVVILTLLWWSGPEPSLSLRYACNNALQVVASFSCGVAKCGSSDNFIKTQKHI